MNTKTILTYLFLYILLNSIGFILAYHFWWTDGFNLSFLKKESFFLLISVKICWLGIVYLSILIIRKFIININTQNFIGPIDLVSNEMYQNQIGIKNATKFKKFLALIAFPILILTITIFITSMNQFEVYELTKNGKIERIKVKEIKKDLKQNEYINFYYNIYKNETYLSNKKNLKVGDKINIIYSINNPKIINYQDQ